MKRILFAHNLFSHAYNLPATTALVSVLDKYETPTIGVNHDFWFEREQFLNSKHSFIAELLTKLPVIFEYRVLRLILPEKDTK